MEKDAAGCLSLLSHYRLTNPGTRRTSPAAYPTIIYAYDASIPPRFAAIRRPYNSSGTVCRLEWQTVMTCTHPRGW
jgi:hypothetical protein